MKHKRGNRGSVEENTSVGQEIQHGIIEVITLVEKKRNRARPREIKNMLVNIQATMATIVEETKTSERNSPT